MKRTTIGGLVLAVSAILAGCSSSGTDATGAKAPIKIGAVSSLTGPAPFPEVADAARVVFDRVNAEGGIRGRKIEYLSVDDGADPAKARQAATRLVERDGVVAMAGSASLVECSANAALYERRGVVSVMGTGIEPTCFTARNIVPVNAGTFNGYESLLYFAKDHLKAKRICPVILKSEGLTTPYRRLLERFERRTGVRFAHVDTSVNLGDDPTPAILAVKKADCDAVLLNPTEPEGVAFLDAVADQGLAGKTSWLMLSNVYTASAIEALRAQGTTEGVYVNSEFVPFTGNGRVVAEWRRTMHRAGVTVTSLAEGGYVAAEMLVDAIRRIDGDITRESVAQALRDAPAFKSPLVGMPLTFDDGRGHNPNRSTTMVEATPRGWRPIDGWITLPG